MAVGRSSGRTAAVAVDRGRHSRGPARRHESVAKPERAAPTAAVVAPPAFHERFLIEEGHAAAFRIEVGGGWANGTLPAGAGENAIAKFLSEAIGLAKQMQAAMGGETATVQFLIADPQAGASRQSAIQVSVEKAGGTVVTLQPGGSGHLVAMLQHFLMALNQPPRDTTPRNPVPAARPRIPGWPYAPLSASRAG
ncbi:hypothetical protein [Dongia sedimenti]|uniref:Roadblock/LC7 domain-containing protein n=1 Tax=Dongia sedimenti TaxID=3064282 RepID=A0ABU0YMB9_9PROT|nr:hypothetical protein [Rhodospirillaceae bacterium R-7]